MNAQERKQPNFDEDQSRILLNLLRSHQVVPDEEADAIVHALTDIGVSIEKVYFDIIPRILSNPEISIDDLRDRLWDLREEFRHIDYHIHDSKLTDL